MASEPAHSARPGYFVPLSDWPPNNFQAYSHVVSGIPHSVYTQRLKAMALIQRSVLLSRAAVPVIASVLAMVESALGCPGVGEWRLPAELESKLRSTAVAEDHLSAAMIYQEQAQQVEMMALKFEETARKITHLEDPKESLIYSLRSIC